MSGCIVFHNEIYHKFQTLHELPIHEQRPFYIPNIMNITKYSIAHKN